MLRKKKRMSPNMTDTVIGEGTHFEGKIRSQASLRIEGRVHGEIECSGDVVIGEKGVLQSDITARNVVNAGTVIGSVRTKGTLTITATGKVNGDIHVQKLNVVEGGIFQGSSKMEPAVAAVASALAAAAEQAVESAEAASAPGSSKDQPSGKHGKGRERAG